MPKRKYFTKQLFYMAVMIIIPVCIVLLLYFQTARIVERLCMDNYISSLEESRNKMDEQLRSLDSRGVDMMLNRNIDTLLSSASPKEAGEGVYPLYTYGQLLKSNVYPGDDFCLEYQIISRRNELIYRNNSFVSGLEFFFNKSCNYPEMSYSQWQEEVFANSGRFFLPAQRVLLDGGPSDALTYVFPLRAGILSQPSEAVLVFLVEEGRIAEILSAASQDAAAQVYMISTEGEVLYGTGGIPQENPFGPESFAGGSGFFETAGGEKLTAYTVSPYNGIIYAALVPKHVVLSQMYTVSSTTRIVLLIYLAVSMVLALIFAYRISKPLRDLAKSMALSLPEEEPEMKRLGELDFIAENTLRLLKRNQSLELSYNDKSAALADIALDRLLSSYAKSGGLSPDIIESLQIPSGFDRCCVAALRIPFVLGAPSGSEFPIFDLEKSLSALPLNTSCIRRYLHAASANVIAAVYVFGEKRPKELRSLLMEDLNRMDLCIFENTGAHPYMGVGRFYKDIYDIYFSFDQALYCAGLAKDMETTGKASTPYIKIYSEETPASGIYFYPIDLEYRLVNCVKSGDVEEALAVFQKIIDENFEIRSLTQRMQVQLCYDLRATLMKVCDELRLAGSYYNNISENIDKRERPQSVVLAIKDEFSSIASQMFEKKRSHNLGLRDRVLDFVSENYCDPQMCVAMAADKFNLSDSYFSQFFKMQTGESFSTYLESLRINKAKDIMDADDAIEIEALCQMVGYNSSNTFRRAFKRVMGVSPSAYRQA
ncbi:MAG: helix-turn-helix domain-containing protein [Christensenellales bacterium]